MKILSTKKSSETIKCYIKENGLTIEELGNVTGLNGKVIQRIERGGFIPTIDQYKILEDTLNLNLDDLTEDKDTSNPYTELMNEAHTPVEKEGLEKFFQMMIALRQQIHLRQAFEKNS